MKPNEALFIDIEATHSGYIEEVGLVFKDTELKTTSLKKTKLFLNASDTKYIVGHNIIEFDKKLLEKILTKFKTKEKKNIEDLKNKLIEETTNR